ncbi:hypothetical protein TNCV_770441 [Trichonephila clavipes]|nr:hypothetical protein TNCV_770441 [Trichonephila clavipes]
MTKPMLKNLITKSAGYDEEDTKLMYEEEEKSPYTWPFELAERPEEFEDLRRTLKQKTHTLMPVRRPEVRGLNQVENFRKFDNHKTRRTGNVNPEKRYLDTPPSRDFDRRAPIGDVIDVIP